MGYLDFGLVISKTVSSFSNFVIAMGNGLIHLPSVNYMLSTFSVLVTSLSISSIEDSELAHLKKASNGSLASDDG